MCFLCLKLRALYLGSKIFQKGLQIRTIFQNRSFFLKFRDFFHFCIWDLGFFAFSSKIRRPDHLCCPPYINFYHNSMHSAFIIWLSVFILTIHKKLLLHICLKEIFSWNLSCCLVTQFSRKNLVMLLKSNTERFELWITITGRLNQSILLNSFCMLGIVLFCFKLTVAILAKLCPVLLESNIVIIVNFIALKIKI